MEMAGANGAVASFDLDGFNDPEGNLVYVVSPARVVSTG
jgi:hypothetical protein